MANYTTITKSSLYQTNKNYTGTGSSNAITGLGFQPDWIWLKNRGGTSNYRMANAVTGSAELHSSSTNLVGADSSYISSFDSDGFTVGTAADTNVNGGAMGSWNWKVGGAGSANTDGTINSTVSVNSTSKMSIVKYTGTGSSGTIGHGLGVAPTCILIKSLDSNDWWWVSHQGLSAVDKTVHLNTNNDEATQAGGITARSATTFSVGNDSGTNGNGNVYVAYCFVDVVGFSRFNSYIGNGANDGTFVFCGFKPSLVWVKRYDADQNWRAWDNLNAGYNGSNCIFHLNLTDQESCGDTIDLLSNGFKHRTNSADQNASSGNYIYMAWGQSIVGTNNVPATAR